MGNCLKKTKFHRLEDEHLPDTRAHWAEYNATLKAREEQKVTHKAQMEKLKDMSLHPEKYKEERRYREKQKEEAGR
ncbi:hypothetical protein CAOG_06993 [Capsaspora owczarzaki ATCC 30864]|uniref:Uncharacterized protein n=1 Tax=Capsaspora owczarzaki (strain ATCC 30864) TaxID=595528 RepID=A0A0D2VYC7_CAPO3|nr:hypothetical protein CAOG_06993 [Capsaspora owczarzaki ATCC 30864]KJE96717.1 hypothetical protein CAOG_006993 [Capsaspora owczarzaki ATCC 30864]|eukprot:XP_004343717.1 hypothetical protein CAOG_06993 [Capsaspora owczarzaki ATCC 30864]